MATNTEELIERAVLTDRLELIRLLNDHPTMTTHDIIKYLSDKSAVTNVVQELDRGQDSISSPGPTKTERS